MRVLHLLSNWKWTERSEPAADLALALQEAGLDVTFGCCRAPAGTERSVSWHAREKGLQQVVELDLPKHLDPSRLARQVRGVRALIGEMSPGIVHCHMPHAHLVAALASRKQSGSHLVRSCYDPEGPSGGWRSRWLMRRHSDGVVVICEQAAGRCRERYGCPESRVLVAEPGIDLNRFSPGRALQGAREFSRDADTFVVGMVTRIRASRRLDLVLEAVSRLAGEFPQLRLLVVGRGRGSAEEDVVLQPAARLGIADRVVLAGYCTGDDLVAAYRAMAVLAYPMPGTDRSCRTVREAMAAGLPVLACRTGFLPVLVEDRQTGRVVASDAEAIAGALRDCITDSQTLAGMRKAALDAAHARFAMADQARRMVDFYRRIEAGEA